METEALSIDGAVEALLSNPQPASEYVETEKPKRREDESGADTATDDHEHTESDQDEPDLDLDFEDGAEERTEDEGDDEEGNEAEEPRIEAPEFWEPEYKARFANLTPEAQKLVAEQAKSGSAALARAVNEAANTRKQAEAEAQRLNQSVQMLNQLLPTLDQKVRSKWANVDWNAYAQQNPHEAGLARIEFEREQAELTQLQQVQQAAHAEQMGKYRQAEVAKLQEMAAKDKTAAKLLDSSEKGNQTRSTLESYLKNEYGIPASAVGRIGAAEAVLAYKAYLYDQAFSRASDKKAQVQKPKSQTSGMRPSTQANINQASGKDPMRRLSQTGSIDDAVAVLLSQQAAKKRK